MNDLSRRFVYVVGRVAANGQLEYAQIAPYAIKGTVLAKAKTYSNRAGATTRAKRLNYNKFQGWAPIACEVVPVASLPDQPARTRYRLVMDNSAHRYIIPAENAAEWDAFIAIPDDDPLSWTVPPFAKRVDGDFTFSEPELT